MSGAAGALRWVLGKADALKADAFVHYLPFAIRLVPPAVLDELRAEAARRFAHGGPRSRAGAVLVILGWVLAPAGITLAVWPRPHP